MSAAEFTAYRHAPFCRPGYWLDNLTLALGYSGNGHVHADCVVDDFGELRIVNVHGVTDGPNWEITTVGADQ